MSRDLSAGGLFLSTTALAAFLISCFIPVWWFTTIELRGQMCSCGTGLWVANVTWGDDITEENYFSPLTCNADNPLATIRCDAPWEHESSTRRKGQQAGVLSLFAIGSLVISLYFGMDTPHYACMSSALAFVFQLCAHSWFSSSHLFSDLSYYFGCHFEFVHALNSNSLICHALGPGWALSAVGLILVAVAFIMFYFAAYPTDYILDPSRYSLFREMKERSLLASSSVQEGDEAIGVLMALDEVPQPRLSPKRQVSAYHEFSTGYFVPLVLLANIALFLYSNMSTGATIEPHIRLVFPAWLAPIVTALGVHLKPGNVLEFRDDVFNFTLVSSLRHFWSSRAYGLAFLIGAFSGIWPYVKCFSMLMMWFVPSSERLKGRALHWIDLLGKWSLIDSFFLCLMCVGFGFDTQLNILGIEIAVNILVRPGWGVYSFVLATIWSLFMSHYLSSLHHHATERRTWTKVFLQSMKEPPHESLSTRPYAPLEKRRRFKCKQMGLICVWILLLLSLSITLMGQLTNTFRFQFSGLAELILPPHKQITDYSMVSIGSKIPDAAREGGYLSGQGWNYFLAAQFFFLAMIVPLVRIVVLMVLWSVPMTLHSAKRLHNFATVIAAWSAMDVFLVAIVAAVMEIGQLSSEVISSAFGALEVTVCEVVEALPPPVLNAILHLVGLPSLHLDKEEGCKLFAVNATIYQGTWILFLAIILSEVAAHLVMELCEASISERMAMLSAYHRTKNPMLSPTSELSTQRPRRGTAAVAAAASATTPILQDNTASRQLRRLLSAQEVGSRNFVGTWFDWMYGPFPRTMWVNLTRWGFMKRVEWEDIGQDLHEDLVVVMENDGEDDEAAVLVDVLPHPRSHRHHVGLERRVTTSSDHLLDELLRVDDEETTSQWMPNSPAALQ